VRGGASCSPADMQLQKISFDMSHFGDQVTISPDGATIYSPCGHQISRFDVATGVSRC
jgi:hypothetical protein